MLVRALIPDPAAIRTGRAMSMPRLESRSPPATGVPSGSGTVTPGGCAACAFVARRTRRCDVGDATRALKQCPTCLLLQVIGSSFSRSSSISFSTPCRRWAQLVRRSAGANHHQPDRIERSVRWGSGHWPWRNTQTICGKFSRSSVVVCTDIAGRPELD
jgi:hypothetical protein